MKTGIIGAMEVEVSVLQEAMTVSRTETIACMTFYEGTLKGKDVVVVRSGIGKVNAGICVQILADRFQVTQIINTGVAGSLNNALNIEDIVISRDTIYHDVDATIFGYAKGEVPQMGHATFPIAADPSLMEAAMRAVKAAAPQVRGVYGRVVSGDQFVADPEKKAWIRDTFQADCCEMESTAIAQGAWLNHLPFVILRAISDKADGSDIMAYDHFEKEAAMHCARIVLKMMEDL
jgi:adenosylhomocysteine nucleosidase